MPKVKNAKSYGKEVKVNLSLTRGRNKFRVLIRFGTDYSLIVAMALTGETSAFSMFSGRQWNKKG